MIQEKREMIISISLESRMESNIMGLLKNLKSF